jgi:hypothetical protein
VVIEAGARQFGICVKIAGSAYLRPCRVDAKRDNGQQQIDDPNAKIFAAAADEA